MSQTHNFSKGLRRASMLGLAVLLLLAGADAQAPADASPPDHIQYVRGEMSRFEQETLSKWRRNSRESFSLVVAAAVCGAVAAGLSQFKRTGYRHVASALGIAVTVLTVVQQRGFTVDHRALDLLITKAEVGLADISQLASPRYYTFETKALEDEWWEQVRTSFGKLHALELEALAPAEASATPLVGLLPRAFAANSRPAWLDRAPQDAGTIALVGEGQGSELASAKEASRVDAEARARAHLATSIPAGAELPAADRDKLTRFLVQAAHVDATYVEHMGGQYRYYTLLRLRRDSLRSDALMFATRQKVPISAATAEAIASASPGNRP